MERVQWLVREAYSMTMMSCWTEKNRLVTALLVLFKKTCIDTFDLDPAGQ